MSVKASSMIRRNRSSRSKKSVQRRKVGHFETLDVRILMAADFSHQVSDGSSEMLTVLRYDIDSGTHETIEIDSRAVQELGSVVDPIMPKSLDMKVPEGFESSAPRETVFGTDDRMLVATPDVFPDSMAGSIQFQRVDGSHSYCSGSMFAAYAFFTSAHCLHTGSGGASGFYSDVTVTMGRNGMDRWFGSANADNIILPAEWASSGDAGYDWAIVELDRNVGPATGAFGYRTSDTSFYTGQAAEIRGYPVEFALAIDPASIEADAHSINMYKSSGAITFADDEFLYYNGTLDTSGGMSGSGVVESELRLMGVHGYGDNGDGFNKAVRIDSGLFSLINDIRNDPGGPIDRADLVDWDQWFDSNTSFISRTSVRPGSPFSVGANIRNNGTAVTGNYTVDFYASTNTTITSFDFPLGSVTMDPLHPFEWQTATLELDKFPNSIPEGTYNIGWIIDSGNDIVEFEESNNTGYDRLDQLQVTKTLPDSFTGAPEGQALLYNDSPGDVVFDTFSSPTFIDSDFDVDSYYFAPQFSGEHTFRAGDFASLELDPAIAIYDADTGDQIAFDDDGGIGDDSLIRVDLNYWQRYIVAIANYGDPGTGDVSLEITSPEATGGSSIGLDSQGDGTSVAILDAAEDIDFFAVTAPVDASGRLSMVIDPEAGLDTYIVLWDDAGNVLAESDSPAPGSPETISVSGVSPGDNFRLSVFSWQHQSEGFSEVRVDFSTGAEGDFNVDGIYDCEDIDALVAEVVAGTNDADFDLSGDGMVTIDDLTDPADGWLRVAGEANLGPGRSYLGGDANLDGVVDVSDFGVWNANKFTAATGWCSGDFNADGVVDVSDFGIWNGNKFSASDFAGGLRTTSPGTEPIAAFDVVESPNTRLDSIAAQSQRIDEIFAENG